MPFPSLQDLAARKIESIFTKQELQQLQQDLETGRVDFKEVLLSKGVPRTAIPRVMDQILFVTIDEY